MRSLLFVPGDSERKLARALSSGADALIVDLEDSVAGERKEVARGLARAFIEAHRTEGGPSLVVRINDMGSQSMASQAWREDLDTVLPARPDAVMLPKPRGGFDVTRLSQALDEREASLGLDAGATRIIAIATEVPASLLAMHTYAGCTPRLAGLAWGREDLSAAIGATATVDEHGEMTSPFRLARDLCLFGAAAAGVMAIDEIHAAFSDVAGLEQAARAAARDGFAAKMAIHPDQVAAINAAFTPSAQEVAEARAIVAAFADAAGAGTVSLDGRMLDRPHLVRAERILGRAALNAPASGR